MKVKAYTCEELTLKPEDCQLSRTAAQEVEAAIRRLDIEYAKKDFDTAFDIYYEALWRK